MCSANIKNTCVRDKGPKSFSRRNGPALRSEAKKGLSIIEVTMASVLLIVAMVPILKNLTRAHQFSAEIERKTQSLVLAQGKLDEIKARSIYNFDSIVSLNNVAFPGTSYFCNVVVTTASTDLKQITVEVGHDEVEVTLATYVARRW
jgi:Tfp pilus assembly protein PilV